MQLSSLIRLLALSAIWGASFLFMRIGAPVLGPVVLIELRVGLAALFLAMVGVVTRRRLEARGHWKHFLILGLFNSALPFLLFAIAARTVSASLLSILNATAPIWAAIIGAIWSRTALGIRAVAGLLLGMVGVGLLVGFDPSSVHDYGSILLGLAAAFSYGLATTYAKTVEQVEPFANAHGSMWAAALILGPAVPFFAHAVPPSPLIIGSVLALGVLCSGIAYLLYFRLIADIGPAPALTVTFLIPVFGVFWGHAFLNEPVGAATFIGAAVVIVGTALVTGFSPSSLRGVIPKAA